MTTTKLSVLTGVPVVLPIVTYLGRDTTLTTASFGTIASVVVDYWQYGNRLIAKGKFVAGTPTATTATITFRDSLVAGVGFTQIVGTWWRQNAGASVRKKGLLYTSVDATVLGFSNDDYTTAGDQITPINGSAVVTVGETCHFEFDAIIKGWDTHRAYGAGQATNVVPGLVSAEVSGTFTATMSGGFVSNPTGTCYYRKVGKNVTLYIPPIAGTSNAVNQIVLSGLPAAIIPARRQAITSQMQNNSTTVLALLQVETNGTIVYNRYAAIDNVTGGTTGSGSKGAAEATISYLVD